MKTRAAEREKPGRNRNITESQIKPFKGHILTHVELEGC